MKLSNMMLSCVICGALASSAVAQEDKEAKLKKAAESVITRVYNVQDLIAPDLDFPLSTSKYKNAFVVPGGITDPSPFESTTSNTALGGGSGAPKKPASAAAAAQIEATDKLIKVVEDFVDRDNWRDNGGVYGALSVMNGLMIVSQTPENHEQIAQLLNALQHEQHTMIRVSADWVLLSPADNAKLITSAGKAADTAVSPIDPAVLKSLPAGTQHFSSQTISRNGQTVHIVSGSERSVVTSYVPVVTTGTAAYATDLSHIGSGLALEVNARANIDQKSALVTIGSTFSDPMDIEKQAVPIAPAVILADTKATTIDTYKRSIQDLHTTLRLPLDTPVIAGSMTLQPASKGGEDQVLTLILKVTASR